MKKYNKLNIIQGLIIILLLFTNYYSYFYHQKLEIIINIFFDVIKNFYYILINEILLLFEWMSSQQYDFSFNNREIAIGIIILVLIIFMFLYKKTRKSLFIVLVSLFNKHFIRVYIEILLYTFIMVSVLYKCGYWKFIYTKDTLLWIFVSALYLSYKVADNKDDEKLFYNLLKNSIGVALVLDFLLNIYTFPIIIELVVIIILIFLTMMIAFAENSPNKNKYNQVHKLLIGINTYIGINILIYLIFEVINNLDSLLTLETLKEFMLPIIFTVMFIPYLFYLLIRLSYEKINIPIKLNTEVNAWVKLYFRIKMYFHCKFNRKKINDLKRFKNHMIINMKTKEDVDNIFT